MAGRVAIVTGAGRGIGAATAKLLAKAGANLALLDQDAAGATHTAEAIGLDLARYDAEMADRIYLQRIQECDGVPSTNQ